MEIYKYKENSGNSASITLTEMKPYNGATHKEPAAILSVFDEDGFMYFRSVYPSKIDAENALEHNLGGGFKEI